MIVTFLGIIGSGKSTLVTETEKALTRLGVRTLVQGEDFSGNPWLKKFYEQALIPGHNKFCWPVQVWFSSAYYRHAEQAAKFNGLVLRDAGILTGKVFSKMQMESGMMSPAEYAATLDLYAEVDKIEAERTQQSIFLNCPPELALKRIALRGRQMESGITFQYLETLQKEWASKTFSKILPAQVPLHLQVRNVLDLLKLEGKV